MRVVILVCFYSIVCSAAVTLARAELVLFERRLYEEKVENDFLIAIAEAQKSRR